MNIEELFFMSYYLGQAIPYNESYQDTYEECCRSYRVRSYFITAKHSIGYWYPNV